jgi:RNA polymerase sigma-70 factor (ECF subfamily)
MTPDEQQRRDQIVGKAFACRHSLLAYAYGSLGDYARAEDVVQSAFLVVMNKYDDFREGTSMLAWCRSIVRLKVLEALRDRKRLVATEDSQLHNAISQAFEDAQEPEPSGQRMERIERLKKCLERLTPRFRDLVKASLQPRSNYKQLALAGGMTVEAVRKGLFRSRQTLRECVAESRELGL